MAQFLFDHTEKCGGTTVMRYLQKVFPGDSMFIINGYNGWHALEHCPRDIPCVAGHDAHYLRDVLRPQRSGVILREPVMRVASLYRFCKQEYLIEPGCTVEQFIATTYGAIDFYAYKYGGLPGHLSGRCRRLAVERAIASILSYDHIGFINDIPAFIESLGFDHPFPRDVIANKTTYHEPISDEDMDRIRQANLLDMQIYESVRAKLGR